MNNEQLLIVLGAFPGSDPWGQTPETGLSACIFCRRAAKGYRFNPLRVRGFGIHAKSPHRSLRGRKLHLSACGGELGNSGILPLIHAGFWHRSLPAANSISPPKAESLETAASMPLIHAGFWHRGREQ
jgi:hypothetical protein